MGGTHLLLNVHIIVQISNRSRQILKKRNSKCIHLELQLQLLRELL
jgi:hypothetical protein